MDSPNLIIPANIPDELRLLPQWVVWRLEERGGKPTKVPHDAKTGRYAASDNPATWASFTEAWEAYCNGIKSKRYSGIGFVFTANDEYCGIDLDHCISGAIGNQFSDFALRVMYQISSYAERSPSGTGLHIICKGKLPKNRKNHQIEMFDRGKYFTFTGDVIESRKVICARQDTLLTVYWENFQEDGGTSSGTDEVRANVRKISESELTLEDQDIINRATGATNGAKVLALLGGDTSGFPSASEADLALARLLVFWTQDPEQIERIIWGSGLARAKWRRHKTYLRDTIRKALAGVKDTYKPGTSKKKLRSSARKEQTAFHRSDQGNAERMAQAFGDVIRYCFPWQCFLHFDGRRWKRDDDGTIQRYAKEVVRGMYEETGEIADEDQRKSLAQHALKCESQARRKAMIEGLQSEPGIPQLPDDLDRDPILLNCLNGTIDLRTGEIREHRAEDLITKLAPVEYHPGAQCPTWKSFLHAIMAGNQELIDYLQKAIGYSLTGLTIEQVIHILYGLGANGKSTFLDILVALLGDYAKQTSTETFMKKNNTSIPSDVAALRGAQLVSASEIERGRQFAEVLVKQMTGGDKLAARFLFGEWFEFKPEFKIWLAVNHKPGIRGTDHAIWRRIRLIPFLVQIPADQQDKALPAKLKAELPGIFAWAVEGCLKWQREGLSAPEAVMAATEGYREEMDVLGEFLSERCVLNPPAKVSAQGIYQAYCNWAETNGERKLISQRAFGQILTERGLERRKSTGGFYWWFGIGLRDEVDLVDHRGPISDNLQSKFFSNPIDINKGQLRSTKSTENRNSYDEAEV